ncbi:AAEL016980-PA [Aedes aegypti]|uniref:AAEL016980-PA n=1 Tax=Aedes aegypti TaxID=7159 RepID=J9HIV8_AEDAE|nr:AAEL016980-PA [Aedes aegypti]
MKNTSMRTLQARKWSRCMWRRPTVEAQIRMLIAGRKFGDPGGVIVESDLVGWLIKLFEAGDQPGKEGREDADEYEDNIEEECWSMQ